MRIFSSLILILIVVIFSSGLTGASDSHIQEIITHQKQKIWLIEDNSLPIISVKIILQNTGSAYDPQDKLGLAQLAVNMLSDGAGDYKSVEYKKLLEKLATQLNISSDRDNIYISIKSLEENINQSLELLMLALQQPILDNNLLDILKEQTISSIKSDAENPNILANKLWRKQVFRNHQYAQPSKGTEQTIANVSRSDISQYITKNFRRDNAIISIVGDISAKKAQRLIENSIGRLEKEHSPTQKIMRFKTPPFDDKKIATNSPITNRNQFTKNENPQTTTIFSFQGLNYQNKNFYPLYILNHIIGGGSFQSRLMQQIREENALAYSVYSYLSINKNSAFLKGSLGTKNQSRDEAINLLKSIFDDVYQNGVTAEELDSAQQYLIGSYPLRMDTNSKLADGLSFIQLENLGIDFLDKRNKLVQNVTLEQVNSIAKKLLNPKNIIINSVGGEI